MSDRAPRAIEEIEADLRTEKFRSRALESNLKIVILRAETAEQKLQAMTRKADKLARELGTIGVEDDQLIADLRIRAGRRAMGEALARLLERELHPEDRPRPWIDIQKRMPHPGDSGRASYPLASIEIRNEATGREGMAEARWEFGDPKKAEIMEADFQPITHWRWARA